MAMQNAPTFDTSKFDLVRLVDVFPELAGERALNVVEITVFSGKPSLSHKELRIKFGDSVRWECKLPFRLTFNPGHSPEGPSGPTEYSSEFNPALPSDRAQFKQALMKSDDWKGPEQKLIYDVYVEVQPGKWVVADPSVIIDIGVFRLFILQLKDEISVNEVLGRAARAKSVATKAKPRPKAKKAEKTASKRSSARGK